MVGDEENVTPEEGAVGQPAEATETAPPAAVETTSGAEVGGEQPAGEGEAAPELPGTPATEETRDHGEDPAEPPESTPPTDTQVSTPPLAEQPAEPTAAPPAETPINETLPPELERGIVSAAVDLENLLLRRFGLNLAQARAEVPDYTDSVDLVRRLDEKRTRLA